MLGPLLQWLLFSLVSLCLVASLLPMVTWPHGLFRSLDFPRTQVLFVAAVVFALVWVVAPGGTIAWIISLMFVAVALIQLHQILRFSPLWRLAVGRFRGDIARTPTARIISVNLKQSNRNYRRIVELTRRYKPDIAIFMETDTGWTKALEEVSSEFRECISHPLANTYGMVLYSKMPLSRKAVRFLTNPEVPSIDCVVDMPGNARIRLVAIHPEPPVISRDSIGRDAEIAAVAKLIRGESRPVVVTGDLNDVAWSRTTRRFLRVSGLRDPREGRGQYNSFHADFFFLRWPLDHLFVSEEFQIIRMQRLHHIGSDHFPMLYDVAIPTRAPHLENSENPRPGDIEEVHDLVDTERKRNRRPIGHDWEDD